jgi:thioredoxin 1
MSELLERVTDASFPTQVEGSQEPYLVEFTSPMCAPCAALEPVLKEIATDWAGKIRVGQIDIAAESESCARFGVMTTPTMILFKSGEPVRRLMGAKNKRNLVEALGQYIV